MTYHIDPSRQHMISIETDGSARTYEPLDDIGGRPAWRIALRQAMAGANISLHDALMFAARAQGGTIVEGGVRDTIAAAHSIAALDKKIEEIRAARALLLDQIESESDRPFDFLAAPQPHPFDPALDALEQAGHEAVAARADAAAAISHLLDAAR